MKLGFLGLGLMGRPMALNLLRGGHDVTVWNRTEAACAPLREAGAAVAGSPAAVTAACGITFAMLADPAAALFVASGPGGACEGLAAGRGYVDMSTVDAATATAIAGAVAGRGGRFLEALDLLGKKRLFLGEAGRAAVLKLVVNQVMGGMMASLCEGLALAGAAGLDRGQVLEVLDAGALANPLYRGKGPRMLAGDFAVAFPLRHMAKDLRLAGVLAREKGGGQPVADAVEAAFACALTAGDGDLDFSALLRTTDSGH